MALEIVGVVANVRQQGLDRAPEPQYFLDYRQLTIGESTIRRCSRRARTTVCAQPRTPAS